MCVRNNKPKNATEAKQPLIRATTAVITTALRRVPQMDGRDNGRAAAARVGFWRKGKSFKGQGRGKKKLRKNTKQKKNKQVNTRVESRATKRGIKKNKKTKSGRTEECLSKRW